MKKQLSVLLIISLLLVLAVSAARAPVIIPAGVIAPIQATFTVQSPSPTIPAIGIAEPYCEVKDITSSVSRFLQSTDKIVSTIKLDDAQKKYVVVAVLDTQINSGTKCFGDYDCSPTERCVRDVCAQSNQLNWYILELGSDKRFSNDDKFYFGDSNTIDQLFLGEPTNLGNVEKLFYIKQKSTAGAQEIWSCDLPTCNNKNKEGVIANSLIEGILPSLTKNRIYLSIRAGVAPNFQFNVVSCSLNPTTSDACIGNESNYRIDLSTYSSSPNYSCETMRDSGIVHSNSANIVNANSYCDHVFEIFTETDHNLLQFLPTRSTINKVKLVGWPLATIIYTQNKVNPTSTDSYFILFDLTTGPVVTLEKTPGAIGKVNEIRSNNQFSYLYTNNANPVSFYTKEVGKKEKKFWTDDGKYSELNNLATLNDGTIVSLGQKIYSFSCTP